MSAPEALGQWPNAPLAYVLLELQFQRVPSAAERLAQLCEEFAGTFPVHDVGQIETLSADSTTKTIQRSEPLPLHQLRNFDNTMGLQITSEAVALHMVKYSNWPTIAKEWGAILDTSLRVLKPTVTVRTGTRYIDLIVPGEGKSVDDYLTPSLLTWVPDSGQVGEVEQQNCAAIFRKGETLSKVLLLRRVLSGIVLPPSLSAMPLTLSAIQARAADRQVRQKMPIGILDIDIAREGARPQLSPEDLVQEFQALHRIESALFRSAFREEALREWSGKEH